MSTYVIGERQYQTDGNAMMVQQANEIDAKRSAACESVINKILEHHSGKTPAFTLSAEYLREALDHIDGKYVHFFLEAADKAVLLFSETQESFSVIMPIDTRNMEIKMPKPSRTNTGNPETETVTQ